MDSWKSRGGKSQRGEEKKREDQKGGTALKRRVQSHVVRWGDENGKPLWREAHVHVKMHKAPHVGTAFGRDVEKAHAIVARSTSGSQKRKDNFWKVRCRKSAHCCGAKHIPSQNVRSTPFPDHFWKLRCRKSAGRCRAKGISKSKF